MGAQELVGMCSVALDELSSFLLSLLDPLALRQIQELYYYYLNLRIFCFYYQMYIRLLELNPRFLDQYHQKTVEHLIIKYKASLLMTKYRSFNHNHLIILLVKYSTANYYFEKFSFKEK